MKSTYSFERKNLEYIILILDKGQFFKKFIEYFIHFFLVKLSVK